MSGILHLHLDHRLRRHPDPVIGFHDRHLSNYQMRRHQADALLTVEEQSIAGSRPIHEPLHLIDLAKK